MYIKMCKYISFLTDVFCNNTNQSSIRNSLLSNQVKNPIYSFDYFLSTALSFLQSFFNLMSNYAM